MGLLDGIMGAISPAINVATGAAGAYQGAQANAAAMQREQMLQAIMMRRQQQQFETDQALKGAQTNSANATALQRTHEAQKLQLGDAGYIPAVGQEAGAKAAGEMQPKIDTAVGIERGTAPIKVNTAVQTAAGVAPIEVNKAVNIAAGTAPIEVNKAIATEQGTLPSKVALEQAKLGASPLNSDESGATTQLPMMALGLKGMQGANSITPDAKAQWANAGGFWKNYLNTPAGRQFMQAANQTAVAAAIATEGPRGGQPNRVAMLQKTYVPSAGDDDATAEQKLNSLKSLIKSATVRAGRGYQRLPDQTRSMIEAASAGAPGFDSGATGANPFASLIPKTP